MNKNHAFCRSLGLFSVGLLSRERANFWIGLQKKKRSVEQPSGLFDALRKPKGISRFQMN